MITTATLSYTLSLHDALPISARPAAGPAGPQGGAPHMSDWYSMNVVLIQTTLTTLLLALSIQVPIRFGVFSFAGVGAFGIGGYRSEEHTSELQSREKLVCRLL